MKSLIALVCGTLLPLVGLTKTYELNYAAAVPPLPRGAGQAVSLDEGTMRRLGIPAGRVPKVDGTPVVGDRLTLRLFDDLEVELELTERLKDVFAAESFIARAVIGGETNRASLVRTADGLQISLVDPREGRAYTVVTSSGGATVREIDTRAGVRRPLPPRKPKRPEGSAKRPKAAKSVIADETTVDVLVAYDRGAESWVAGEGGITNFALASVAKMNVALANTGLDARFRFRLVGVTTVEARSTNVGEALDGVTDGEAGWEPVAAARAKAGADIVSVLIDTGSAYGTTGIGWSLDSGDGDYSWFAAHAYNVCSIRSVAQSHTMTHEVGHNMGAGHSDRQADSPGPQLFPYSSGFYFQAGGKDYHTIMAYESDGVSSVRYAEIPYFSSPDYAYAGVPVGDADHDNTRTLANTFYQVAAFMMREEEEPGDGEAQVGSFVFDYTVCDGEASVNAVYPADARQGTKLVIPAFLDGYPVTHLASSMLDGCPGIRSVVIPDTVIELDGVFCCYHSLEEIDLGKGVRSIGGNTFWSCNLRRIHIPASVTFIGFNGGMDGCALTGAFGSGITVPAITVDPENPCYVVRDGALYDKNLTELLCCPVSAATVALPETVEFIDDMAFYGNSKIECVKIPASVSSVRAEAFSSCSALKAIDVDAANPYYASVDGVLYDKAVSELICVPLGKQSFTLPASVASLHLGSYSDRNVFSYYSWNLTDIFVEEGNPAFSSYDGALYDKSGRTLLYIPQGKTSLTLSPAVADLGDRENIFEDLSLERLDVATGNATFATDAAGILYDARFENLLMAPKAIRSAVLPTSVKSIGANAFSGCRDLRSVTFGGAVDSIGTFAFGGCVCLTSVQGMKSVREIGDHAFSCCYWLKELDPLDTVAKIGNDAFYFCEDLPALTFGRTLAFLGERAFYGCESLRRVDFRGNAPEVVFSSFWDDNGGPFLDTPEDLRICVADGSLGWNGDPQSSELPEKWPVGDPNARTITHQVYGISYVLAGGVNAEENPIEYAPTQLPLALKTPVRDGCSFEGWLLDGHAVTEIPRGTVGDLVLTAKWGAFGPGVWTTNVSAAKTAAARDGTLVCVVFANYAGCYYSQLLWPNLADAAFLAWARQNGVYLVNADETYDLGGTGSTQAAEQWFFTLYGNWPETDGYVYFPTVAVAYPEAVNAPIGLDVFRPEETVGGGYYDGTVDSLIDCLSFYVDSKPVADVSVPEVAERYPLGQNLSIPVAVSGVTKPRVTVSGLPRGVSYANGCLSGKPSAAGDFSVTVKADFGGGVIRETAFSLVVYDPDGCLVRVDYDAARGSVTGAGAYKRGKKATLRATAKKGFVLAGWRDAEGRLIAQEPSLSFTVERDEEALSAEFILVEEDWATADCATEAGSVRAVTNETKVAIAPISVVVAGGSLPTVKVAGLPSGLKFTAKDILKKDSKTEVEIPANTIYGTPAKGGVYNATVTVTTAGKASAVRAVKFVIRTAGDYVADADWDPVQGKVTGVGVYQAGKKVTLKATANRGYVFAGWTKSGDASAPVGEDADGTVKAAALAFAMPSEDVAYAARFVTAEEDRASIRARVNGTALSLTGGQETASPLETNVMCGVYLEWQVAASALSLPTVAVSGLPSGLKFTAKPITAKVTSGTGATKATTTVTNVPPNTIYGAPTAASKTDKYGAVTPSKVKVTVTTAGKSKAVYEIALTVDPLPAWAVGEFSGLATSSAGRLGSASMSVTAAGKVSGKVIVNGTNVSFTAASYDITSKTVGETNLVAVVTGKLGKEAVAGGIAVVASGASGTFAGAEMTLCRNVWKDKGAKSVPAEAQGLYTVKLGAGERGTGYLSLTVDKKGAVKVAGKAPDGTALSASATLMPNGDGAFFADVFAAPSAYKGGSVAGRLAWDADGRVSSDGLDWTSFNPGSTTEYYAGGFDRGLSASGAWYSKTATLLEYYTTLDFKARNGGLGQVCWESLTVSVDQTGKKFVVDQKKSTPVQDKVTKTWSYDGANDAALDFSFTQATGIWKGSFLWWFDEPKHTSQKIPFEGIMVQGEDLEGFGTYDVQSSYIPHDKNGKPQMEKTYKVRESLPVKFVDGNKDM